jgi:hypothetical protein
MSPDVYASDERVIPSFIVGKRDAYHAKAFMADLASRIDNRVKFPPTVWLHTLTLWSVDLAAK